MLTKGQKKHNKKKCHVYLYDKGVLSVSNVFFAKLILYKSKYV